MEKDIETVICYSCDGFLVCSCVERGYRIECNSYMRAGVI